MCSHLPCALAERGQSGLELCEENPWLVALWIEFKGQLPGFLCKSFPYRAEDIFRQQTFVIKTLLSGGSNCPIHWKSCPALWSLYLALVYSLRLIKRLGITACRQSWISRDFESWSTLLLGQGLGKAALVCIFVLSKCTQLQQKEPQTVDH